MSAVTKVVRAACQMWIPLAVLALALTAMTWPRSRAAHVARPGVAERIVAERLTDVPSHNRLYRASLALTSDSAWVLRLRSASGAPVRNARIAVDAWMPEQESAAHAAPTAADYVGGGVYRVRPVVLDRAGWWNISVHVSAGSRTDSLAFNVILR